MESIWLTIKWITSWLLKDRTKEQLNVQQRNQIIIHQVLCNDGNYKGYTIHVPSDLKSVRYSRVCRIPFTAAQSNTIIK